MPFTSRHKIGDFDTPVRVEENTVTTSATGRNTESWTTYFRCKAKVINNSANSRYEAHQEVGTVEKTYIVRYSSETKDITNTMRIYDEYDEDYFYIQSKNSMRREGWIELKAISRDND